MSRKLHPDMASRRTRWEDLAPDAIQSIARLAMEEDMGGWGFTAHPQQVADITSNLLYDARHSAQARLRTRQSICLCGVPLIPMLLAQYDPNLTFQPMAGIQDGVKLKEGDVIGQLSGPAASLFAAERVVLNFIQHLSGVATLTAKYVAALGDSPTRLLDTRKTHPIYRALEKYAVSTGGGWNHRRGLYDRFMIKDNHFSLLENMYGASWPNHVYQHKKLRTDCLLEVEVDRLDQLERLLEYDWIDVFLLDNFSTENIQRALDLTENRVLVELSGGVTLSTIPLLGKLGADFISCGALTHQSQWPDIGLDME
jgi:nicotinate-nucleotide pyrophosphorylase (carboxylating)